MSTKTWKPEEMAWLLTHEDRQELQPVKVKILSVTAGGVHPIKAVDAYGTIYYCRTDQLSTRKAKAERKANPAPTEKQKTEIDRKVEIRMKEIKKAMEREKFDRIKELLYALQSFEMRIPNEKLKEDYQVIKKAAEDGIFAALGKD